MQGANGSSDDHSGSTNSQSKQRSVRVPGRFSLRSKGVFCFLTVVLADVLFFDVPLGGTAGVFTVLLGGLVLLTRGPGSLEAGGWLAGSWVVVMGASLVVQVPPLSVLLAGMAVFSFFLLTHRRRFRQMFSLLYRMAAELPFLLWAPVRDNFLIRSFRRRSGWQFSNREVRWGTDWLLPGGLLVFFVVLFSMANPVISSWSWWVLEQIPELFTLDRILIWIGAAVLAWGLLRHRPGGNGIDSSNRESEGVSWGLQISPPAVTRSLFVFNLLFLIQNVLDFVYLWGGGTLPKGMTYAEYAHRGSYPLVVTALLAAVFVLISFRANEKPARLKWARYLVYVWLGQNVLLLVSAAWRLASYVDVYGLTRWRMSTVIWMGLVAAGLVLILIRIAGGWSNRWLINVNAVFAVLVLTVCTFIPLDAYIASYNVRRCREVDGSGSSLDVAYLNHLGPDALPALKWVRPHLDESSKREQVRRVSRRLSRTLHERTADWQGYTVRRIRLLSSLRKGSE